MKNCRAITVGLMLAALAFYPSNAMAAKTVAPPPVSLTDVGQKLEAKYAEQLTALQADIQKALPKLDEKRVTAFQEAGAAVRKAEAAAVAAKKPLEAIGAGKALVEHAKGKWIGGAETGIAKAQADLKKATTDAEREAAQKDLANWEANKADGLKALAERQAALDKAIAEGANAAQVDKDAQAALAEARANEITAARALLAQADSILSNDNLDATLVKCSVLTNATPRGLAEFAQQGPEQAALVEQLLADNDLLKQMLHAGGAKAGKYGQAMKIYTDIQKASTRAKQGIFHRLALGTSLEHAVPIKQRNATADKNAPEFVDPVKRYLHYEKAYLDGELDPAFKDMTTWECRYITDSYAPDENLAWGRQMLRDYRPDHILNPDYGWRYSGAVRTDVAYRHSQEYTDTDSLDFFQNVIKNGGICGRRAFFGAYICKSFGIPTWGVAQHAHAALGRWTPAGWVVNFGANWDKSWSDGRQGLDFLLETQARKDPQNYWKVLRAQAAGDALSEKNYDSNKPGSGGLWNNLALFEEKVIVADAKPAQLAALGQDLAEANESAETKATAVAKATPAEADKKITIDPSGVITIPAAVCQGAQLMNSFLGGQQMTCGASAFSFEVDVPRAGKYTLKARVVNVHDPLTLQLTTGQSTSPIDLAIPYTIGAWQQTAPVEVNLVQGKNTLSFSKPKTSITLKDFTLTPVK